MNLSLVMFKADGTRRDFPITKDRVVLGRKPTCDLRVPLSSVSRQHCEIEIDGDTAILRDLGSSNGTFHNSVRIQEQELAAGDEVKVGPVIFTVLIDGEPEEIEPVRSYLQDHGDGSGGHAGGNGGQRTQERPAADGEHEGEDHGEAYALSDSDALSLTDEEGADTSDAPTADLDDPLAALERMAEAEGTAEGGRGGNDANPPVELADDEFEILEEDDQEQGKRK